MSNESKPGLGQTDRDRLAAELRACRWGLADNAACLRALRRLHPPHLPFGVASPGEGS